MYCTFLVFWFVLKTFFRKTAKNWNYFKYPSIEQMVRQTVLHLYYRMQHRKKPWRSLDFYLFYFIWKAERDRDSPFSDSFPTFPQHNSQDWARPKLGAGNSLQVHRSGHRGSNTEPLPASYQEVHLLGSRIQGRNQKILISSNFDQGWRCPKRYLHHNAKTIVPAPAVN